MQNGRIVSKCVFKQGVFKYACDCARHEDALFREAIHLKENGPSWQQLRLPCPTLAVFKSASLCHLLWIYTIAPFFLPYPEELY